MGPVVWRGRGRPGSSLVRSAGLRLAFGLGRVKCCAGTGCAWGAARVWQADGPIGTAADAEGRYQLGVPLPGTYRIVYQYIGFLPETLSVAVGSGEQVRRDVSLSPTRIAVPAVESRASVERVHESRTPEPVTVIPKAAAEKAGKLTIGEAATLAPGCWSLPAAGACVAPG